MDHSQSMCILRGVKGERSVLKRKQPCSLCSGSCSPLCVEAPFGCFMPSKTLSPLVLIWKGNVTLELRTEHHSTLPFFKYNLTRSWGGNLFFIIIKQTDKTCILFFHISCLYAYSCVGQKYTNNCYCRDPDLIYDSSQSVILIQICKQLNSQHAGPVCWFKEVVVN